MPGPIFWGIETLSVACVVHLLWTTRTTRGRRRRMRTNTIAWSLVALIPILGPLVYGAFHLFPSVQEEDLRAAESNTEE